MKMKYSGIDFEGIGKALEKSARMECPLPAGYPYPRLAACPDLVDGYAACYWFVYPERLRHLNIDRMGMGIRAEGLPMALRPFSLNGFIARLIDGKLALVAGRNGTSNEKLCREYLARAEAEIRIALQEVGEYER